MQISEIEFSSQKVDASYRVNLPGTIVRAVGWITGDQSIKAWLVLLSADRCRLVSQSIMENDPQVQALASRINTGLGTTEIHPFDTGNEVEIALAFRLAPIEIKPPQPLRRVAFPKAIAAAMQLSGGTSEVAALIFRGHIEFWTIDLVRASVNRPILELI